MKNDKPRIVYHVAVRHWSGKRPLLWGIKQEGKESPEHVVTTQREAIKWAASLANRQWDLHRQKAQIKVHGKDGKIRFERTFGMDPEKTEG